MDDLRIVQLSCHQCSRMRGATVGMTESLIYVVGVEIGRSQTIGDSLRYADSDFAMFTRLTDAIEYYDKEVYPKEVEKYPHSWVWA